MAKEENIFTRLTSLFRAGPVVKRRIKEYKPSEKTTSAYELFKKTQSQVYSTAMSAYGSYDRMARYCLAGDTNIAVNHPDKRKTIKDIVDDFENGTLDYGVFSIKDKNIVFGEIERAWCTGEKEIWEITLDDGNIIRCTDNHPFMLRSGEYKRADELIASDALMPFRRSIANVRAIRKTNNVELVYDLTIKDHHNFALTDKIGQGIVFVHNSDFQEMEYCLAGDTKIAVPDGYKTLEELCNEYGTNKEFVVYSYDHNLKRIVPAIAKQARQTCVEEGFKVTFDTGKSLTGTGNHRLMLKDGSYRRIDELQVNDAMMPFYRKDLYTPGKDKNNNYRLLNTQDKNIGRGGWISEHKYIAEWAACRELKENEVVHHINFKKYDNNPNNLQIMTNEDHLRYHVEILNGAKWSNDNSAWIETFKKNHSLWMKNNNPAQRKDITFGRILEICEREGFNQVKLCKVLDTDPNVIKRHLRKNGFNNFEIFAKAYDKTWVNSSWNNAGNKNPRYRSDITYQKICNTFLNGKSIKEISASLNTTTTIVNNRIRTAGFKSFNEFAESYTNHKVVSIESIGKIPMFDITVDGYKNFATDSIISHNTPEIASALDIYSEETISPDENGNVVHIYSENASINRLLSELFYDTLNVNFNMTSWVRNMCKYGDFFLFNDVSPEHGVVNVFPISVNEMEREEGFDKQDPMAVRYRWITQGNQVLQNWQVSHFRLLGNDAFLPYGTSVLEAARRIWRQLILIEDAMLVYRVVRSPDRRVFYIDVGNVPPEEIPNYMEQAQTSLRKNQVVDKTTGRVDLRYNPLSVDEDYFIPVRGGASGTKIEPLAGGTNAAAIEDVQYIQKKLFSALKIPKAYLGYDEGLGAKATLCLRGNTLIPLLDGRTITIKDMTDEFNQNKQNWTYSSNIDGNSKPGKVINAWATKQVSELHVITLDNGKKIECTDNHPLMLRDGTYLSADKVKIGMSLMPLYRRLSSKKEGDLLDGYEMIMNDNKWKYTHKIIQAESCNYNFENKKSRVIHHADFDKRNNNPDNLKEMTWMSHRKLHSEHLETTLLRPDVIEKSRIMRIKKWLSIDRHREFKRKLMLRESTTPNTKLYNWIHGEEIHVKMSNVMKENWKKEEYRNKKIQGNIDIWKNDEFRSSMSGKNHWISKAYEKYDNKWLRSYCNENNITCFRQFNKKNNHPIGSRFAKKIVNESGFNTISSFLNSSEFYNHKIINIEVIKLDVPEWVYDLTIEDCHNFGTDAGIIVHNSQEDIRFSRSINRIQRTLISELNKLAIIHLYCNGFDGHDLLDFEIKLTNPSTIAQQQKLELFTTKFTIANTAHSYEGLVDKRWIRKNIFSMTDEEIELINKGLFKDKELDLRIEAVKLPEPESAAPSGEAEGEATEAPKPENEPPPESPLGNLDFGEEKVNASHELDGNILDEDDIALNKIMKNLRGLPVTARSQLSNVHNRSLLDEKTGAGANFAQRDLHNRKRRKGTKGNIDVDHAALVGVDKKDPRDSIAHPFGDKKDIINPLKNAHKVKIDETDKTYVNNFLDKNIDITENRMTEIDSLIKTLRSKSSASLNMPEED